MSRVLIRVLWLMLISGLSLQGCTPPKPVRLGAPIEGFSHTSAAINRFSVNGGGGPNLAPYGYGGGQNVLRVTAGEMAPRADGGGGVGERS